MRKGVSAIVQQDSKILLIKREKAPYKNRWSLPGGKVEENEEIDDAIKREVMEETGYIVNTLDRVHVTCLIKFNWIIFTRQCEILQQVEKQEKIVQQFHSIDDIFQMKENKFSPHLQLILKTFLHLQNKQ